MQLPANDGYTRHEGSQIGWREHVRPSIRFPIIARIIYRWNWSLFRTTARCFDESLHRSVCTRDLKNEVAQDKVMPVTLGYLPIAPNHEGNSGGDQCKEWSLCKMAIGWFGNAGRQELQLFSWRLSLLAPMDRRRRTKETSEKPPFWT